MKESIRNLALQLGFDSCGFTDASPPVSADRFQEWLEKEFHGSMSYLQRNAEKRMNPDLVLPGARSIVSLAVSYHPAAAPDAPEVRGQSANAPSTDSTKGFEFRGEIARYARHVDYHELIGARLTRLTAELDRLAGHSGSSLWYVDTGPLLERDLGQRAGVGFVGKHTGLISRKLGNWFFLAEILTRLPLEPDTPEHNRCGSCTRCLGACPTQAIVAPFRLDARRCISYLTIENKGAIPIEFRSSMGSRIFGCDDCLAACPWNRFAKEGRLMREHHVVDLDQPRLLELLRLSELEFKARFANTPLLRSKRKGLLRNVCVALGNVADASALPDLEIASQDLEPLIREHALWAIQQIRGRVSAIT